MRLSRQTSFFSLIYKRKAWLNIHWRPTSWEKLYFRFQHQWFQCLKFHLSYFSFCSWSIKLRCWLALNHNRWCIFSQQPRVKECLRWRSQYFQYLRGSPNHWLSFWDYWSYRPRPTMQRMQYWFGRLNILWGFQPFWWKSWKRMKMRTVKKSR